MKPERTAVYRFYDGAGRLLYVGVTIDPPVRFARHAAEQPWWCDLARVDVVWYAERALALKAEAAAILSERPRYNVAGRPRRRTAHLQPGEASALDRVSRCVLARRLATGEVQQVAAEAALRAAVVEASREVGSLTRLAELLRT